MEAKEQVKAVGSVLPVNINQFCNANPQNRDARRTDFVQFNSQVNVTLYFPVSPFSDCGQYIRVSPGTPVRCQVSKSNGDYKYYPLCGKGKEDSLSETEAIGFWEEEQKDQEDDEVALLVPPKIIIVG